LSACRFQKHLKEKGFVVEDENRFLRLTPEGIAIAREVLHNREILIQFLRSVLGVEPTQAETDACKIEHLLSKETSHQLMAMVQLLQSGGSTSQAFLESFKSYKLQCPSLEECNLCSAECLMDVDGHPDSKSP
jgi:Mn-dependent DtxR family transcriptional regulator